MKKACFTLLIMLLLCNAPFKTVAQPDFDDESEDEVPDAPVDSGIAILAGTALCWGLLQTLRCAKKKHRNPVNCYANKFDRGA